MFINREAEFSPCRVKFGTGTYIHCLGSGMVVYGSNAWNNSKASRATSKKPTIILPGPLPHSLADGLVHTSQYSP